MRSFWYHLIVNKTSVYLQIIYAMLLAALPISTALIFILKPDVQLVSGDSTTTAGGLAFTGIIFIAMILLGLFWPNIVKWEKMNDRVNFEILRGCVICWTIFFIPALMMIMFAVSGLPKWFTLPILLLILVVLTLSFPTNRRIDIWRNYKSDNQPNESEC
jgi:hypothetical protein